MKNFKILLVYPNEPLLGIAPNNLALLAACLKQDGFEVKLFDTTIYKPASVTETNDSMRSKLGQVKKSNFDDYVHPKEVDVHEDFNRVVEEYNPNLIAVTLLDSTITFALSLIEKIKDKKIPVVTGGVGSTFLFKKILDTDLVDYVCIGEGEEALVEIANKLNNNEDCSSVRNFYFKKDGKIIKNPLRPLTNIDKLPNPDFSIYEDWRFYRPFMGKIYRMLQVDIDRGCPYSCTYCAAPGLRKIFKDNNCGNYYRIKNIDKVFEEMKYLIKKHNIEFLWISSETHLAMKVEKIREFAERYKKEINLPFWTSSRLDTFSEEKTKLLAEMGCKSVAVGIEHGSEEIRNKILNKRISNAQIIESFKTLSKYDIFPTINNMMGIPGETREDVFKTIELNREISVILNKKHNINSFVFLPFSGTKLKDVCVEKKYFNENDDIPCSFHAKSTLKLPTMSQEEIDGLEKTMLLYILLPKSYYPDIKIAEQDNEEGHIMFDKLIKYIKS